MQMKALHFPDYSHANAYQKLYFDAIREEGVEVIGLPEPEGKKIIENIKKHRPDVLHIHWIHPYIRGVSFPVAFRNCKNFLRQIKYAKKHNIKVVWTIHNLFDHEGKYKKLELYTRRSLASIVDKILPLSNVAKELVFKHYKIKTPGKVQVIPHGHYIDYYPNHVTKKEAREKLKISDNQPVFLFFGMIRPYKGIERLIEVAKSPQFSGRFIIAGKALKNEYLKELKEKCTNLSNINFYTGYVDDNDIQTYMNAADYVVFPFRNILSSGSVILAMSFKKPVIAPEMGALPEILPEEGVLFFDGSDEMLEKTLIMASKSIPSESKGISNFEAAQRLDWNHIAISTKKAYLGEPK